MMTSRTRNRWPFDWFASVALTLAGAVATVFAAPPASSLLERNGFDNPPLRYDGGLPSDGYWPHTPSQPATASPDPGWTARPRSGLLGDFDLRQRRSAAPVASRDTEVPTRVPQDDWNREFPPITAEELADDEFLVDGPKLSAYKSGFFQKLSFTETYLPRFNADGLGLNEIETFVTVAVPMPTKEWPMLITPYFQWRALDGPTFPDAPPNLYETYVDMMWVPRVSPRWTGIVSVAPSFYSDFESGTQDGFRLTGKGFVRFDAVPERLQMIAGVLYLNRHDIRILPAGGLIWDPNPDVHYEVIFPRPKFAHRIAYGNDWENWLYLAGEFGGNSFDITRTDGTPATIILYDNRISFGFERKRNGGAGWRIELGVVFNRRVELTNPTVESNPGTTAMVRGGITF